MAQQTVNTLRSLYDRYAHKWDSVTAEYSHRAPRWALDRVRALGLTPRSHLDLGCANGNLGKLMSAAGYNAQRVGLDLSPQMVKAAWDSGAYTRVMEADLSNGVPATIFSELSENSFDLVTAISMLEFIENIGRLLSDIYRLTSVDGTALLTFKKTAPDLPRSGTLARSSLDPANDIRVWHHAQNEVEELLNDAGFEIDDLEEGEAYRRTSAVTYWYVTAKKHRADTRTS